MNQKTRHNKKRNTAFLFEVLARELTKSFIDGNAEWKNKILNIIKEHFKQGTTLAKDLELYKSIYETKGLKPHVAEKLLHEVKIAKRLIDPQGLFDAQSELIGTVNKTLSKQVFNNFIPNYKSLATIAHMFNQKIPAKNRIFLEEVILKQMISKKALKTAKQSMVPVDNLVYRTFVEKFNAKYGESLLEEQKALLNNYILSFSDNAVELKIFLNEELERLRGVINESLNFEEIKNDPDMIGKTKKVLRVIAEFKNEPINEKSINQVLKIQNLAKEIQE
tara:strand:+ start:394 stop:1227 length:834 start_codon:yes stop_codon:yes gene_type:complete